MQFIYNLLHQKISQNIQLRQKAGIPQGQVRMLLKELSSEQPSKDAKQLYERLIIEANTQLKLLSLPRAYKAKHRDLTLQTALRDFQQTYGITPHKYIKQQIIQKMSQSNRESEYSQVITRDDVNFTKFGGEARQRRERKNPYSGQQDHDFDNKDTFLQQELNNPDLMLQKKLKDKYLELEMKKSGLFIDDKKEVYRTQKQLAQISKQSEEQKSLRLEQERIQNEIVQNAQGEYVRRSQLRILNSQTNKKGPLQGLPNYLVINLNDGQKLDVVEQDNKGKAIKTKEKIFDIEAFDPKMVQGKTLQQMKQLAQLYDGQVSSFNGRDLVQGTNFNLDQTAMDKLADYIEKGDFQKALAQIQQGNSNLRSKIDRDDLNQLQEQNKLRKEGKLQKIEQKSNDKEKQFNKLLEKHYMMQHVETDYILKALRAGIRIDNFIYNEMIDDHPQWNQLVYKRNKLVLERKKYPTLQEGIQKVPLTKGELDFIQAERRFTGRFKQEFDQICKKIQRYDDKELYDELVEEHASLDQLGRRYKKGRKQSSNNRDPNEIEYFKSQRKNPRNKEKKQISDEILYQQETEDLQQQQKRIQREIYDMSEKIKVVKKHPKLLSR